MKYQTGVFDSKHESFEAGIFVGREIQKGNLVYNIQPNSSDYFFLSISKKNFRKTLQKLFDTDFLEYNLEEIELMEA